MNFIDRAHTLLLQHITPQGTKILSLLGFLLFSWKSINILRSFSRTFLLIGHNLSQRYGLGSWAVITGAAGGIGSAFALELATRGFNLVLIDFNEEKLSEVSLMVQTKFPHISTKNIVCNFANSWNEGFYDSIVEQLQGLDISLLINNVGTATPPGPFYSVPEKSIFNTITVNVVPMTILTRKIIPLMLKRSERSGIINLSSTTGALPSAVLAVYSATKAYVDFFSRAIEKDVKDKIDVLSIRPDAVSTGLIGSPKVGLYIIKGEDVARAALRKLGNVSYAHGDWRHEIKGWLVHSPIFQGLFRRHFLSVIKIK